MATSATTSIITFINFFSGTNWSDGKPVQSRFDGFTSQPVARDDVDDNNTNRSSGKRLYSRSRLITDY